MKIKGGSAVLAGPLKFSQFKNRSHGKSKASIMQCCSSFNFCFRNGAYVGDICMQYFNSYFFSLCKFLSSSFASKCELCMSMTAPGEKHSPFSSSIQTKKNNARPASASLSIKGDVLIIILNFFADSCTAGLALN